jgi:CTP:molybdopterin cytidylyltransferase MocA
VFVEVTHSEPFAGLILAGGEGRRWGCPKAWARLPDGRTFLEACFGILREAGARPIVATLPPGAGDPGLEDLSTVVLPVPGLDMFASLKAALDRVVEFPDWTKSTLLPVDHPLITTDAVAALISVTAPAAIPSYRGKHGHPVCVARSVVEKIVGGELTGPTLRDVLRTVEAVDVPVDDIGVISNCNTPDALRAALRSVNPES